MISNDLPKRQSGVVLVVVVAAIVMMLVLLALMVEDQHILIRRIANQKASEQGYQYAQGLSAWAERVLHDDQNRTVDYLGEDWAKFGRPEPEPTEDESQSFTLDLSSKSEEEEEEQKIIDFGFDGLEYRIDDLQGRFNLNNLVVADPNLRNGQKKIFINLLELLEVGEFDERERLYGALYDWLDENDTRVANGFDGADYTAKDTPYYSADQKLTAIGELRFVEGFTAEIINKLKPHVAILPVENARININTTTAEVLASTSSGTVTNIGSVQNFLQQREDPAFLGFESGQIEQAKNAIIGASATSSQPVADMMQVTSQFYQITSQVTLGGNQYCMQTVVLRESAAPDGLTTPQISVLNRQHSTLCEEESPVIEESDEDLS